MITFLVVGLVLSWAALGALAWFAVQLWAQNGRVLLRLEVLEEQHAASQAEEWEKGIVGRPVRSVLNDFELPALGGGRMTLSQWRGRRIVLIFFDPRCTYCWQLLPDLAMTDPEPSDGRPVPVVVSTGDPPENRRLIDLYRVRCPVLLQDDSEVAALYQVPGTPMAYLVDEGGATASPLVAGADAVLALARADGAPVGLAPLRTEELERSPVSLQFTRPPGASRYARDGLPVGAAAPDFCLPGLVDEEICLADCVAGPCCWCSATLAAHPATSCCHGWRPFTARRRSCRFSSLDGATRRRTVGKRRSTG